MKILVVSFVILIAGYGLAELFGSEEMEGLVYYEEGEWEEFAEGVYYDFQVNCTKPGKMCRNCKNLVNCIQVEQGKYMMVDIQSCDISKQETCLINQCSSDPNPKCMQTNSSSFSCHNTGVFPDPFDCQVYHICVDEKDKLNSTVSTAGRFDLTSVMCEAGFGFNPVTTYCDKKLVDSNCPFSPPVPVCKSLGQMGPVGTTSIFYICLQKGGNIIPELFLCPHGSKFNSNGVCA